MLNQLADAYRSARSRLLLLDYDGVLAPIVARPDMAAPTQEVLMLLRELSTRPGTKIVVVSGRDQATLENWLGGLEVDMSAEHGHFTKIGGMWHAATDIDMSWREEVEVVMRELEAEYPGSHIETKPASLVWHYRQVEGSVDEDAAKQKIEQAANGRADVMSGKCVVDVRATGANKGDAVRRWYETDEWDFVLCIGDDVTDEAMFAVLPEHVWTVKVGPGETRAYHQLDTQADVIVLLRKLTA